MVVAGKQCSGCGVALGDLKDMVKSGTYCFIHIASHCERPALYKGYCIRHYWQVKRYGRLIPEREREVDRSKKGEERS